MKPTLPAYRFRVRSRATASTSPPATQSRNTLVLPAALISVLLLLAIAAPPALPRTKWLAHMSSRARNLTLPALRNISAPATAAAAAAANGAARVLQRRLQAAVVGADSNEDNDGAVATVHVQAQDVVAQSDVRENGDAIDQDKDMVERTEANLAYFIQISQATLGHLPRLLARIHHTQNVYVIHFDRKIEAKVTQRIRTSMLKRHPEYKDNVMYMEPELITYRGVSMLLNTINAMRELLRFNADWDYFINISGADYPLVSQTTMRTMLGVHLRQPLNFLSFAPMETWEENLGYRMDHIYIDEALSFQHDEGTVQQLPVKNPLARSMQLQYANAEAWMINSRDFSQFVVTSGYARKMLLTFAYSVESSEHYFATLIWNHERFNRTIVGHAMREVIWHHEGQHAGQHPFYVDEKGANGAFTFRKAVGGAPTFFIRKFKKAESPLMDFLDGRWENEAHLKVVREKFDWHVGMSMDEHASKPPLKEEGDD